MKGLKAASTLMLLLFCAGCATPDLVVKDLNTNWNSTNKKAKATIANVGKKDAGDFLVYTSADEAPTSQNYRPQIVQTVPGLGSGDTLALENANFAPLSRTENNDLGNICQLTVVVDPTNMVKESNESNNTMSAPAFDPESKFVFHVVGGSAGVSGGGSQGPAGNNLSFIIDKETGCTIFEDYTHATFTSSSDIPSSLHGTTIRLKNGVGRYNFAMGTFSDLQFNVQVQDPSGNITSSPHSFSGSTSVPLPVPVGGNPPTGANLKLYLSSPTSIDLGGGTHGNVTIDTSELISATDL